MCSHTLVHTLLMIVSNFSARSWIKNHTVAAALSFEYWASSTEEK